MVAVSLGFFMVDSDSHNNSDVLNVWDAGLTVWELRILSFGFRTISRQTSWRLWLRFRIEV